LHSDTSEANKPLDGKIAKISNEKSDLVPSKIDCLKSLVKDPKLWERMFCLEVEDRSFRESQKYRYDTVDFTSLNFSNFKVIKAKLNVYKRLNKQNKKELVKMNLTMNTSKDKRRFLKQKEYSESGKFKTFTREKSFISHEG